MASSAAAKAAKRDAAAREAAAKPKGKGPLAKLAAESVAAALAKAFSLEALVAEERALSVAKYGRLRALRVLLQQLPPRPADLAAAAASVAGAAAAAADDAVRPFAARRLAQMVELHGGTISDTLDDATTHIIALPHAGWAALSDMDMTCVGRRAAAPPPPPSLEEVEAALAARSPAEAALLNARLRARMHDGAQPLFVVSREWLDERLAAADAAVAPATPDTVRKEPPSELGFALRYAATDAHMELAPDSRKRPAADAAPGDASRRIAPRDDALSILLG